MIWTNDPELDDMRYQERLASRRKKITCVQCGEWIEDETVYCDEEGFICEHCLLNKYKANEEDLYHEQ